MLTKILIILFVNLFFLGGGLLLYFGKADGVLTLDFGKSPLEKEKLDYTSFHRTALAVMILLDLFCTALIIWKL